jgi:hypothetical protein
MNLETFLCRAAWRFFARASEVVSRANAWASQRYLHALEKRYSAREYKETKRSRSRAGQ